MRRRRLYISVGLIAGFFLLVLIGLAVAIKSDPGFYAQSNMPSGQTRAQLAVQAKEHNSELLNILSRESWKVAFTADELNAFFQEDYFLAGGDENLLDGFHDPRVKIEDGKMRVGLRYGKGLFSTVLSMEVRAWKVQGQVNTLAVEITKLQAGRLPLSPAAVLDDISEVVRRQNIDITWYRHDGHPVAIMRFQADQTRPTFQFDKVELKDGNLTISGHSMDFSPPPTTEKSR